uniref:OmpA family protein n=1 Tax=Eiseniibacteriota bacterium TaxID=2212470 RepID=A0A832I6U9_UNCEI
MRRPILLAALLALLAPAAARAAEGTAHWYLAPYAGWTQFDEKFGKWLMNDPRFEAEDAFNVGGRLGYLWPNGFGLEVAGGWTPSSVERATPAAESDMTFWHATGNLIYQPTLSAAGGPFLSAGFGLARTTLSDAAPAAGLGFGGAEEADQGVLDFAAGWHVPFGERAGLRLEARNLLWVPKDKWEAATNNYLIYGGALAFNFGGGPPPDADADGVPDKRDRCPNTPAGARVDVAGCPADSDGDGVFDGLDQCDNTPKGATVDARGCPSDADGDKVYDGLDQCADTPKGATVDARGCPSDADGDGVFDGLDQCANTPTGAKVDARGCPTDGDGDGVLDGLDQCANTPAGAKVDKDGCPIEITERETELLDTGMIRLQNINFETGKADLLPDSYATLDIVGQLLSRWPDLRIEIGGHTDARGSNAANQKLSEARANSVRDYLLQKFPDLKADQYSVKGYGESKPVAPNNNAVNMAKNRRVEFTVLNKDVLRKESERRKMLQN